MRRAIVSLLSLLVLTTLPVQGKMPTLEDEHYKTACGPIAELVALKTLGIETTLPEIAKRCGLDEQRTLAHRNTGLWKHRNSKSPSRRKKRLQFRPAFQVKAPFEFACPTMKLVGQLVRQ